MHYILWIPNWQGSVDKNLERVGLSELGSGGEAFEDPNKEQLPFDPHTGRYVTWTNPMRMESNPPLAAGLWEGWTWMPAEEEPGLEAERFWFGWDPQDPPEPRDVLRNKTYDGHPVDLKDGNTWIFPAFTQLDSRFKYNGNGKVQIVPDRQWEAFCAESEQVQRLLFEAVGLADFLDGKPVQYDEEDTRIEYATIDDGLGYASRALAINYRLNMEIACGLDLFSGGKDGNLQYAIAATVDMPNILATLREKKTLPDPRSVSIPVT